MKALLLILMSAVVTINFIILIIAINKKKVEILNKKRKEEQKIKDEEEQMFSKLLKTAKLIWEVSDSGYGASYERQIYETRDKRYIYRASRVWAGTGDMNNCIGFIGKNDYDYFHVEKYLKSKKNRRRQR